MGNLFSIQKSLLIPCTIFQRYRPGTYMSLAKSPWTFLFMNEHRLNLKVFTNIE